jgi:hypothetical protein
LKQFFRIGTTTTRRERYNATKSIVYIQVQVAMTNDMANLGEIAKNKEGKMYIMRGYNKEMAGMKIPDKQEL